MTSAAHTHILSIIVEDYFQVGSFASLIPNSQWHRFESRLEHNLDRCLSLLAEHQCSATFFVCGWIAEHHAELLQKIVRAGHEVACQGYYLYGPESLHNQRDLRRLSEDAIVSKHCVERATGQRVEGFRLARQWMPHYHQGLLETLKQAGFRYDASMCRTGYDRGEDDKLESIHAFGQAEQHIYEVPGASAPILGWFVPLAGGNYWRQFPLSWVRWRIRRWLRRHDGPLVAYFHLWELDPEQPVIDAASRLQKMRHYRNLKGMTAKLTALLSEYRFTAIRDYFQWAVQEVEREPTTEPELTDAPTQPTAKEVEGLTLVIPCYNEAETLPYLLNTLKRFARKSRALFDLRLVLVNDGSQDDTAQALQACFADWPQAIVINHPENRGIAAAIMTGVAQVETPLLAVIDADCTFDPLQLLDMYPCLDGDTDVVSASPLHSSGAMHNVSRFRWSMSAGAAWLHRQVFHQALSSYTSCFRLYRREAFSAVSLTHHGFSGVTQMLAQMDIAGYRIKEFPAQLDVRLLGESKIRLLQTIYDHLRLVGGLALQRWRDRGLK